MIEFSHGPKRILGSKNQKEFAMPGVNKLIKEAQKMQAKMQAAQADLANKTYQASVAGGAVEATVNGQGTLTVLKLEPEFLKEAPEMIASSIVSAVSQAQHQATEASEAQMGALAGPLKGIFG